MTILTLCLLAGCRSIKPPAAKEPRIARVNLVVIPPATEIPELPKRVISIYKLDTDKLKGPSGSFRYVPKTVFPCLLHSNVIWKIEMIPRDKEGYFYDLKLYFNKPGCLLWKDISHHYKDEKLGFLLDGLFYRTFKPKPLMVDEKGSAYTVIDGPFDKFTARELKKWSPKNYAFYHQEDSK